MNYPIKTILIMAGGTGGHIMPGLAVADHLRDLGWHVVWMGNPDGMEARLVPNRGYEMAWVRFSALRGKGLLRKLLLPFNLLRGFLQARAEIRRVKPDVVLGMGGFITFPGGLMAALAGIPLVLHEQNSIAGLANRVLARFAKRVLTGFPDVIPGGEWVGNPVREAIAGIVPPEQRMEARSGPLRVLVVGGSLGAQALNSAVPEALAKIPIERRPVVTHQAGEKHIDVLRENYKKAGVDAVAVPFIDDMAKAYGEADLVICRAGALTIAELAAAGVASVLVPYPFAVDDHQTGNARFLTNAGAAMLLPQAELNADTLALMGNLGREQLLQMARQARALAKPDATGTVAAACAALAG